MFDNTNQALQRNIILTETSNMDEASTTLIRVIRRNGQITPFNPEKIATALRKAISAVEGALKEEHVMDSKRINDMVELLTLDISDTFERRMPLGGTLHIEDIQDIVELSLMRQGLYEVAKAYVLYRQERKRARETSLQADPTETLRVMLPTGQYTSLTTLAMDQIINEACADLPEVNPDLIIKETRRNLFDGVPLNEVYNAAIMSARTLIEKEPNYSYATGRLLLITLYREALTFLNIDTTIHFAAMPTLYPEALSRFIHRGIALELIDPALASFDLVQLGQALKPKRDKQFTYLGLQTLYDRYFIHHMDVRFELPQVFFMRVAMGLAVNEKDKEARAIEFYELLSSFDYMSSTPTLFNAGTLRPQLSSCYLTTVPDDLSGIYNAMRDNALLSKYAGGLGNDWTPVRAIHARIKGTNGKSQGVVPFLKVANDTAVAVNQGGKRKGAVCAYLETWHLDVEEFLELRKNTGDERRRTHDMNTANWIPDLFMKRVIEDKDWTLFSPDEVPDLHDLYGRAFEERYAYYEQKAEKGLIKSSKKMPATKLWRKMLGMLFETGHPWVTFKDPCNLRSPQQHVGVVHSSNLCTEITLNTSEEEIAVCNLGSVNLEQHLTADHEIDHAKLQKTINTAMRMLDNVIDINFYSVPQARRSNLRHRPVGLGIMGFQNALYLKGIPYASDAAVEFADRSMEAVSYYAIQASTDLAQERGAYATFEGSLWSKGILPIDSIALLAETRGKWLEQDRSQTLDWNQLRERVKTVGMRNSNTLAIAPTATISNICGVAQSIEPTYQNLFVKSNLSGEFTVINPYLVNDLKARGLWDDVMVNDLKYYNGSIQEIERIPASIRALYATSFEMDPTWLIFAASRRQKWIDQAQSLNLYMAEPSGKKLDALYRLAWQTGLKTTYYLRSLGATSTEKSTLHDGALNAVKSDQTPQLCPITDPTCEACQ